MYKVVKHFLDLQDNSHEYNVGDTFPRDGKEVSLARITELSTEQNRRKTVLIEEVKEEEEKVLVEENETEEKPQKATRGRSKGKK